MFNPKINYQEVLKNPLLYKDYKLPIFCQPTITYNLHRYSKWTTNDYGNIVFICNPYFLLSKDFYPSQFNNSTIEWREITSSWVSKDNNLNGIYNNSIYFTPFNCDQFITNIYNTYRVVSAELQIRSLNSLENTRGIFHGCISTDNLDFIGGVYKYTNQTSFSTQSHITYSPYTEFTNINYVIHSLYHKEFNSIQGIKINYIPISNNFYKFHSTQPTNFTDLQKQVNPNYRAAFKINNANDFFETGCNLIFYGENLEPRSPVKIDMFINYECTINPSSLNIISTSLNTTDYNFKNFNYTTLTSDDLIKPLIT